MAFKLTHYQICNCFNQIVFCFNVPDVRPQVNGALATSVVAAIFSCTASILYSLDAAGLMLYCYNGDYRRHLCAQYMVRLRP